MSTVVQPYVYNGGKRAGLVDVKSLSLITQDDVNKSINKLSFVNYDCPDPRMSCISVNNYVNNNHLIEHKFAPKDKDGYQLPVEKTYVI